MSNDLHGIRAVLTVIEGPLTGTRFELDRAEISLGSKSQITLNDPEVAPIHALITNKKNRFYIRRHDESFPLYVNGSAVERELLTSMDEILLGQTKMIFTISELAEDDGSDDQERDLPGEITTDDGSDDQERDLPGEITTDAAAPPTFPETEMMIEYKTRRMESRAKEKGEKEGAKKAFPLKVTLKVTSGVASGQILTFQSPIIVVGRTIGDVVIADPDISRKHCSIEFQGINRIFLHDHASTNGTYLNGDEISYSLLKSGDKIQIGSTTIKILFQSL
ncbi:FHA domain-containing protein [candidate division CSSED10-310 bacterium]|uniref:FHA domain-containing protein n=1 Tax=candidate division CSSED10-310 bacterium TaxID=2855610 RepID=A0ABV6YUV1_UNCC1